MDKGKEASDGSLDLKDFFEYDTKPDIELKDRPVINCITSLVPLKVETQQRPSSPRMVTVDNTETDYVCILCAEKHETETCPKTICALCHKRGHSEVERYCSNQEVKSVIETKKVTKQDFSQIVCMNCGELGHISCGESSKEVKEIPWTPLVEFAKLDEAKEEEQEESQEEEEEDIELNFAEYMATSKKRAKRMQTIDEAILELKRPKYMRRLEQSKFPCCCCKCGGGDHCTEECEYDKSEQDNYEITTKRFKEDLEDDRVEEQVTLFPH